MLAFGFLYPAFLAGLGALALPVLIHLIHRRRTRVIEFPSLRFLRLVEKRIARRRRLEELLVLLLRAAALALLALGLAAPIARTAGGGRLSVARALVIDNSMSMALSPAGADTILERSRAAARELLAPLSARDAAAIIALHPRGGAAHLSHDIDAVRAALGRVRPSLGDTPLEEGVRRALEALAGAEAAVKDLVLFTDLQERALERLKSSRLLAELPEQTRFFLVAPPARRAANLTVEAVVVRPLAARARGHRAVVSVVNHSSLAAGAILTLEVDGSVAARREIRLAPGAVGDYPFDLPASGQRELAGVARLSGDELPGDDRRFFVLPVRRPVPVLVISDAPARIARLDPAFYLGRALGSGGGASIAPEVVSAAEALGLDPAEYGAVILADPGALSRANFAALDLYLERGGGVLVFLGPSAEPGPLGGVAPGLGGLALAEVVAAGGEEGAWRSLLDVDWRHAALLPLAVTTPPVDLARPRLFRTWRLAELPAGARVLARASGGDPALVEVRRGRGRLLVFTSSANPEWNDLAWRVSFVPLLHSLVHYLAWRAQPGGGEWVVERPLVLSWPPGEEAPLAVEVALGDQRRRVEPQTSPGGAEARLGTFDQPGVARLKLHTARGASARLVALNIDPAEGDLARGEVRGLPGEQVALGASRSVASAIEAGLGGFSFADPLLAGVLVLLLLEGLLAARVVFGRGER